MPWIILIIAIIAIFIIVSNTLAKRQEKQELANRLANDTKHKSETGHLPQSNNPSKPVTKESDSLDTFVRYSVSVSNTLEKRQEKQELANRLANDTKHKSETGHLPQSNNPSKPATKQSDPLDTFVRYSVSAPTIWQDCPMVYRYPNISVMNVNRTNLQAMVKLKKFEVLPVKDESGAILLKWDGITVAHLAEKIEMCSDWLDKQLPLRCEFAAFGAGKEKVALFFYKDQESTLQDRQCEIVKLTSCMSTAKQETISFLEEGEKLFIEWDDNDKPYLRDISYNPIGSLPAKFNKYIDNDLIDGIFFDHTEVKENEDWEKEDKLIPFVRVYTSKE